MNKEIKEIAETMFDARKKMNCSGNCRDCEYDKEQIECSCNEKVEAERLYNEGYRKTVWHKVADGDLPKENQQCWCYCNYSKRYLALSFIDGWFYQIENNYAEIDVIAWTELPLYKGEE